MLKPDFNYQRSQVINTPNVDKRWHIQYAEHIMARNLKSFIILINKCLTFKLDIKKFPKSCGFKTANIFEIWWFWAILWQFLQKQQSLSKSVITRYWCIRGQCPLYESYLGQWQSQRPQYNFYNLKGVLRLKAKVRKFLL